MKKGSLKAKNTANKPNSRSPIFLCILVQHKWFSKEKKSFIYILLFGKKDKHALPQSRGMTSQGGVKHE